MKLNLVSILQQVRWKEVYDFDPTGCSTATIKEFCPLNGADWAPIPAEAFLSTSFAPEDEGVRSAVLLIELDNTTLTENHGQQRAKGRNYAFSKAVERQFLAKHN